MRTSFGLLSACRSLICLAIICSTAPLLMGQGAAQTASPLNKDPLAVALAQQIVTAAGGGQLLLPGGIELSGTIQIGQDPTPYPIRVYALASDQVRTEIDQAAGTSLRIL